MADVAKNAHQSSTDINNGRVITAVDKQGNYKYIEPEVNDYLSPGTLETKYTNRFDDPRYYTGDANG